MILKQVPDFFLELRCPDRSHNYGAAVYYIGKRKDKEIWYVWLPCIKNKQCGMEELKKTCEAFVKEVEEKTKETIRKRRATSEAGAPDIEVLVDLQVASF